MIDGVDEELSGASAEPSAIRHDVIILGARAAALLRSGIAVRAFVMTRIEHLRRCVTFASGRTLVLENGYYQ